MLAWKLKPKSENACPTPSRSFALFAGFLHSRSLVWRARHVRYDYRCGAVSLVVVAPALTPNATWLWPLANPALRVISAANAGDKWRSAPTRFYFQSENSSHGSETRGSSCKPCGRSPCMRRPRLGQPSTHSSPCCSSSRRTRRRAKKIRPSVRRTSALLRPLGRTLSLRTRELSSCTSCAASTSATNSCPASSPRLCSTQTSPPAFRPRKVGCSMRVGECC